MTPPNVEGAPNPTSSVRISRIFGAPSGGMVCGGHADLLSLAFGMIEPEKGPVGSGRTRLLGNSTADGEPGVTRICCPKEALADKTTSAEEASRRHRQGNATRFCTVIMTCSCKKVFRSV